ncbi:MAG: MATE family efflux transporter [Candidatus Glassbacteria bacterium]|nr:MATE family efflux transporter [Candidatus Glassbacteria bacterium]
MGNYPETIPPPAVPPVEPDHLGEAGLRLLFRLSLPLILNHGAVILMLFCDRMFLSWYGTDEISAVWPAIFLCWAVTSFFYSITTFVNIFVAQYHGARKNTTCAATVWQGIYYSIGTYLILLALLPALRLIFDLFGHRPEIARLEKTYFTVIMFSTLMWQLNNVLAGFFTGRGKTRITMTCNLIGNAVNILLDWVLIFGHLGFPRLGILGAALATTISSAIAPAIMLVLFLGRKYQQEYRTRQQYRLRTDLIRKLLRTGAPIAFQDMMYLLSTGLFFMLMGRTLPESLAANNIAWSLNDFLTLYMHGIVLGVMTLAAQFIGAGRQADAGKITMLGIKVIIAGTVLTALLYLLVPEKLLYFFRPREAGGDSVPFELILPRGTLVLHYLIAYNFLYGVLYCIKQALRGLGDTSFFLKTALFFDLLFFMPGILLVVHFYGTRLTALWNFLLIYLALVASAYYLRFRSGNWRSIYRGDLHEAE